MWVEFDDGDLSRLYTDAEFRLPRFGPDVTRAYRKAVGLLYEASDDQELRNWKALRLERLKGNLAEFHSIRIKNQWRLLLKFRTDPRGRTVVIVKIVDYH